jgi:hypothetical protein
VQRRARQQRVTLLIAALCRLGWLRQDPIELDR